jgi:hypothetical protein
VLARLAARHAERAAPFDFTELLARLGVVQRAGGGVDLDDGAPLAAVRKAIIHPASAARAPVPGSSGKALTPRGEESPSGDVLGEVRRNAR